MSDLLDKKCVPCEGGVVPFDISEIDKGLLQFSETMLSTQNKCVLLDFGDVLENNIYVVFAEDIMTFCIEKNFEQVWVIGGQSIYKQFLGLNLIDEVYITEIMKFYTCDTFFPTLSTNFSLVESSAEMENDTKLYFKKYIKKDI